MPTWGIATTIKAPLAEVEAFVAHHLALGADRIILHFDDADDPAADAFDGMAKVEVIRCDDAYWQAVNGGRPAIHETRQTVNIQRAYGTCGLDWLAHIDGDEFIWTTNAIGDTLGQVPPDALMCRMEPWEALHTPGLTDDIFNARWFRKPIFAKRNPKVHAEIFDPFADCLSHGVLSHSSGKAFFRCGVAGLQPRIHGALVDDERLTGQGFNRNLHLLHFHAQDPYRWKAALPYRLAAGAYRFNPELADLLTTAAPDEIDMFYHHVVAPGPMLVQDWVMRGFALRADLHLRDQITAMRNR